MAAKNRMHLYVSDDNALKVAIPVDPSMTVLSVKTLLTDHFECEEAFMDIKFRGAVLDNSKTLQDLGIKNKDTVFVGKHLVSL